MTGPGSEYRDYEKPYRPRTYRVRRITSNTTYSLLKNKWAIGVIIFSFLFVFINVIALVFAGDEEDIVEELAVENIELVFFDIVPGSGEDLQRDVMLGEQIELTYIVTNVGEESGVLSILPIMPNEKWNHSFEKEGASLMEPGDSTTITLTLTIPEDYSDFMNIDHIVNPEMSGSDMIVGTSSAYSLVFGSDIELNQLARFIGVAAMPLNVFQSIEQGSINVIDPRINVVPSLIRLDPYQEEIWTYANRPFPDPLVPPSFDISMDEQEGSPVKRISLRATDEWENDLYVINGGDRIVLPELDCRVMPVNDYEWQCTFFEFMEEGEPLDEYGDNIDPGGQRKWMFYMQAGSSPYKRSYNLLIWGVDRTGIEPQVTSVYLLVVEIEGGPEKEDLNEMLFRMIWGGGFHYERYLWLIFLAAICGSGLIANDIRDNSLSLYLSRPITWIDYLEGKASSLFIVLSTITIIPAAILFFTSMAFSDKSFTYVLESLWLLGGIVLSYVLALFVFISISLALSSLSRKWIYSGVAIFVTFIFTSTLSDILYELFKSDYVKLLNFNLVMKSLFRPLFGLSYYDQNLGLEWYIPLVSMTGVVILAVGTLVLRFRKMEVTR